MKHTIAESLKKILPATLLFAVVSVFIRLYEYIVVTSNYSTLNVAAFELRGIGYDVIVSLSFASVVMLVHLMLSLWSLRIAYVVSSVLFTGLVILSFCITHYFTVTLFPLSTDLYGYSLRDIATTIRSSGGTSVSALITFILILTGFIAALYWIYHANFLQGISAFAALCSLVIFISLILPHHAAPENFDRDIDYYLAVNKTWYFTDRTKDYIRDKFIQENFDPNAYPFLHRVEYTDSLGQYFHKAPEPPSIVMIIVEGLGRDFTGPQAPYGGFTPFLDSLSQRSLYWENAVSNAGRTFGALPSILGSLPYGSEGFMGYGASLPDHQTLVSLLKPHGYRSSFFYGGSAHFDNQDIFLEYQGIDRFIDESKFPASYRQTTHVSSWGFADDEVFTFAAQELKQEKAPRLDIYLTLTTHEPFISPNPKFDTLLSRHLENLSSPILKKEVQENKGIFSCLLYTDNAIRNLFRHYQSRADFSNTIFIVTGDHRLIPMAPGNKIKRFHIPLIVYSPLLKQEKKFASLAVHSNITPTLLNYLAANYNFDFPDEMPFISGPLHFDSTFSSNLDVALTRSKNEIRDYVDGEYFLSDDRLYKILPGLNLEPIQNETIKKNVIEKLKRFKAKNTFACDHNRVDKRSAPKLVLFTFSASEQQILDDLKIESLDVDQQFIKARDVAFEKQYLQSRTILKYLLNKNPNYHDARILLARTYAWDARYDSAMLYIQQALQRSPYYADAYVAWGDLEYWQGHHQQSAHAIKKGLSIDSSNIDLRARHARVLILEGKNKDAEKILLEVLAKDPNQEIAKDLIRKLKKE
ncbi:LTA synthase family protein [Ohtaekwangia koreensis]|uniref:Phosphoglycerol transferase MdoB n=1 Tax=Ohtaekwangia koreensis TaxID=688867 RepID=A0A1T5M7D7_9BACT|nr:LTA synthase family protein [Ohtaekwangia koreensis]SKC84151.1 Phosphoglycerol transferase MdoB [Ohtaekwangia koreensis]